MLAILSKSIAIIDTDTAEISIADSDSDTPPVSIAYIAILILQKYRR
jgi:hypothetical protein